MRICNNSQWFCSYYSFLNSLSEIKLDNICCGNDIYSEWRALQTSNQVLKGQQMTHCQSLGRSNRRASIALDFHVTLWFLDLGCCLRDSPLKRRNSLKDHASKLTNWHERMNWARGSGADWLTHFLFHVPPSTQVPLWCLFPSKAPLNIYLTRFFSHFK